MLNAQRHPLPFKEKNLLHLAIPKYKIAAKTLNASKSIYQTTQYKYGRNSILQQAKQVNKNIRNSPFLLKTARRSPICEPRDEKEKQKVTINWRKKYINEKKRTYSNQYDPQNAQQQMKYHLQLAYDNKKEHNRNVYSSQKTNISQLRRRNLVGKPYIKAKRNGQQQLYHHLGGKKQEEADFRIMMKQNRFASIDISQNINPKASFIELISKFQFKNLKTAHQTTSSSKKSIKIQYKQADKLQNSFPSKKDFNEQDSPFGVMKNRIKTASKGFQKYEIIDKRCQNTQRKINFILSPWATDSRVALQAMDLDI